jgi:tRNA A-37 threonylcarbamoyl transferase component Bud32
MSAMTAHRPTTHSRFTGRSLILIRAVWIVSFVILIGVTLAALPSYHNTVTTICDQANALESTRCYDVLDRAGISQQVRGAIFTATHIVLIAAYFMSGILIYWQLSDQRLALLVSLALMGFNIGLAGDVLILIEQAPQYRIPLLILRQLCRLQLLAMLFYFPGGRFVPRWTVWIVVATAVINTLIVILGLEGARWPQLVALTNAVLGLGAQIYRYRRVSGPVERQQTKWVIAGIAATFLAGLVFFLPRLIMPGMISQNYLPPVSLIDVWYWVTVGVVGMLLLTALPISIALAVLRYRLWGADALLNRGLVYGGVTLLLGLVFVGAFFLIHASLERVLGGQQDAIAAVVSTALVVGLFQPTLTRLRRLVDRRLYRINVDYHRRVSYSRSRSFEGSPHLNTPLVSYENMEPLGQGGMAELYKAHHPTLGRPVAIKILLPGRAELEEYRVRFEREARAVAALKHPNIVQLYDYGESGNDIMYMVMEFVAGSDLAQYIEARGGLPLEEVRHIVRDIASALDYAHASGIVHRDVKPANVILEPVTLTAPGRQYRAVLADFGLVKITDMSTQMTQNAGVMGTLDYIAPEQIEAQPALDGRADIYALGVMTYEMLTGRLPFKAPNPLAVLMMHMNEPPPDANKSLPGLPEYVSAAIMRAMAKKPDHRYATAGDFSAALL